MAEVLVQAAWLLARAALRGVAVCGLALVIVEPLSTGSFMNAGVAMVGALLARVAGRPLWYGLAALGVLVLVTAGASAWLLAVLWMMGLVAELAVRRFARRAEEAK